MFCKKCNAPIEEGQKFCTECGAPVELPEVDEVSQEAAQDAAKTQTASADTTVMPPVSTADDFEDDYVAEPLPESAFEPQTQPMYQPPVAPPPVASSRVDSPRSSSATAYGAPVAHATQQHFSAPQTANTNKPKRKLTENKPLLAGIIAGAVVILAIIAVAIFLLTRGPATTEVYYGSEEPITVARDTTIIAYSESDEPLAHYVVALTPKDVDADDPAWMRITVQVDGTDGFNLSDVENMTDGTYSMSITDTTDTSGTNEVYYCPDVQVTTTEEKIQDVILRPDPNNPEGAKGAAQYEYSYITTDVQIVHNDYYGTTRLNETWRYPQFTSATGSTGMDSLNSSLKSAFDSTLEDTKNWSTSSSYSQCTNYTQTVTYLNGPTASIRTDLYVTGWGPHGVNNISGQINDLNTGTLVTPESVLGISNSELRSQASSAIKTFLASNPSDISSTAELNSLIDDIVADSTRYYLTDYGLVIITRPYELGSYAYGSHDIVVQSNSDEHPVGSKVTLQE